MFHTVLHRRQGDEFAVAIHIPGYLKSFEVTLNGMRLKENDETKSRFVLFL